MKVKRAPLMVLLMGCAPAVATAASLSEQALREPLTLQQAVAIALESNYGVRQALARVDQTRGGLRHAGRIVPANPELEVATADRESQAGDHSRDFEIRLSQELWIGGQRALQRQAAQSKLSAAQEEARFLQAATAARARRAFLNVLLTERARDTAERLTALTQTLADYAQRRLEAGSATVLEVNSAVIGVARARTELAEAERQVTHAELALSEVLGSDPVDPPDVVGEIVPWQLELPDRATLLSASVRRRADLAAAAARVSAAQEELQLTRRQLVPNLTVFGFYEEEEDAEISGFGVSLPVPLLHRSGGERDAAAGRLLEQQLRADELRLQVRREVLEGMADYRAAHREAELLGNDVLARAEENLRLVRESFEAGKVGAPAITAAQDNLISVRRSYLAALGALIRAITELERATGGLITLQPSVPEDNS